jgi:hypothetical protein
MYGQIATGATLIVFAGLYWLEADAIPKSPMNGSVGADGLPKLLAIALCGLSLILIAQAVLTRRRAAAVSEDEIDDEPEFTPRGYLLAAVLLGVSIVYTMILPYVGYTVAMGLLLLSVGYFYNKRLSPGIVGFAVVGAIAFHLIFITLLGVRMPAGVWHALMSALASHVA